MLKIDYAFLLYNFNALMYVPRDMKRDILYKTWLADLSWKTRVVNLTLKIVQLLLRSMSRYKSFV